MEIRKISVRNQVTLPKQMVKDLDLSEGDQIVFRKLDSHNYVVSKLDEERLNSVLMIDPIPEYQVKNDKKI